MGDFLTMINKIFTISELLYFNDVVEIETNISDKGLPTFEISGLISKSVEESKKRVYIALENSGFSFPLKNIIVNIAPANIPKSGTHYDLSIAISIIKDRICIPHERTVFLGELSFDGGVRGVDNIFYLIVTAIEKGFKHIYIPSSCVDNILDFKDVNIYPISNLQELSNLEKINPIRRKNNESGFNFSNGEGTYSKIRGNFQGKKAISYSLIGKHSLFIQGFPGVGKSMLAKSMVDLSPDLTLGEFIDVNKIYSYSGISRENIGFVPPFRNPHPLSSYSSLFGSFSSKLVPGEVSLANKGILFLDEFPEFNRLIIEGLRIPLENKEFQLSRSSFKATMSCDFIFIAAANPCKCGYFNHKKIMCSCSPIEIRRYQSRISGPIMDRIDIKLTLNEDNSLQEDENKNYPFLEYSILKKTILEKRNLRNQLLGITNNSLKKEFHLCNLIVQNYMPIKIYNIFTNEIKKYSISERAKNKMINLIFTISLFNNRDQISIEDMFEGLNLCNKN